MKFSFVIPVFNEAADVIPTIEAARNQTVREPEIVVIDDGSTDGTREVLRELVHRLNITLIEQPRNLGAAAARNAGIHAAHGDILVFADADVRVPPDFLEKLTRYYEDGCDFVTVDSRIENRSSVIGRFQQATHDALHADLKDVGFSQAFSCRRSAALAVGFPESLPGCGGEDGEFFDRLHRAAFAWGRAPSIVVEHKVPDRVGPLWRQWCGRGWVTPFFDRRIRRYSLLKVVLRRAAGTAKTLGTILTVIPAASAGLDRARRSPQGLRDLPAFLFLYTLTLIAQRAGDWAGLRALVREERASR